MKMERNAIQKEKKIENFEKQREQKQINERMKKRTKGCYYKNKKERKKHW